MFEDPLTELWLTFAHGNLTIFSDTIRKLQGQNCCAVESAAILGDLEVNLTARHDDGFIPVLDQHVALFTYMNSSTACAHSCQTETCVSQQHDNNKLSAWGYYKLDVVAERLKIEH